MKHRAPNGEPWFTDAHTNRVYFSQVLEEAPGTACGVTWGGQVRVQTQKGQDLGCIRSIGVVLWGWGKGQKAGKAVDHRLLGKAYQKHIYL